MEVSKISQMILSLSLLTALACEKKADKVSLPSENVLNAKPAEAAKAEPPAAAPVADANAAPQQLVEGAGAAPVDDSVQISFPGAVASQRRANLSFRVGGYVETIKLKIGDTCKKGSVLATLDDRDYKLNVDMAKAQVDLAKAAADNAIAEFKREEELKAQNASSDSNFDKLKAANQNAIANYKLAQLRHTQAEQALGDTKLVAPYDCVISKQLTNVGQAVKPGDAAYDVYDVSDIEVSFNVPERMAGKIKLGEKIHVRIPATGFEGNLEILRVVTVVDDKTRTFQVVAKAPQNDERIVPGLYAEGIVR